MFVFMFRSRSIYVIFMWPIFRFFMFKTFKNFMAPLYGLGSSASRLEPLRGDTLFFTTKFPEVPDTHFIDLRRMKG